MQRPAKDTNRLGGYPLGFREPGRGTRALAA